VFLLGKKYSGLQWTSMALLGMSLCVAKVQMFLPLPKGCTAEQIAAQAKGDPGAGLFLFGVGLVLAASVLSGLAGVSNELLLKKRDKDVGLWRKNLWTYQWGVIFNTIGLLFSYLFGGSSRPTEMDANESTNLFSEFFRGYDFWVWAMIFVTALLGISVSMIMKYFDNIVKCFGGSLILYSTTLASMFFFGSRVDADFVLGLFVYSVSSYFYAGDHNQKLDKYAQFEEDIEAMINAKVQASQEMTSLTKVEAVDITYPDEMAQLAMDSPSGASVLGRQGGVRSKSHS